MATLRDIKNRIVGVKNTQKITKAMKMVAAARLRRAQENIINARPYSRKITEVLSHLMSLEKHSGNPLLQEREVKKIGLVLVTSDRGLCGSFNMNIINKTISLVNEDFADYKKNDAIELFCVGKKGFDVFKKTPYMAASNMNLNRSSLFDDLTFDNSAEIANEVMEWYIGGKFDRVVMVYNRFKNAAVQEVRAEQLLPVLKQETTQSKKAVDYLFEPSKTEILNDLVPKSLKTQFFKALLDSFA